MEIKQSNTIRRESIIGSRRLSNYWWASVVGAASIGFLFVGIQSYITTIEIRFFPQGLVMSLYGFVGIGLSLYLWCTIIWSIGSGFNEFNKENGFVRIFRWGFPGKYRKIDLIYPLSDIENIRLDIQEGLNPKRVLYLCLKGKRDIPLTRVGQPMTLSEIEKQAADLANFLQVDVEGV